MLQGIEKKTVFSSYVDVLKDIYTEVITDVGITVTIHHMVTVRIDIDCYF